MQNVRYTKEKLCLHCGAPLFSSTERFAESRVTTKLQEEGFCCQGCKVVYGFLQANDFNYYEKWLAELASVEEVDRRKEHRQLVKSSAWREWDSPQIAQQFTVTEGTVAKIVFFVPSLLCAACIASVEKGFAKLFAGSKSRVNLFEKTVTVWPGVDFSLSTAACFLHSLGLTPFPLAARESLLLRRDLQRRKLKEIAVAGAVFGNVMLFSTSVYFGEAWGMQPHMEYFFNASSGLLTSFSLFYSARSFFKNSWSGLKSGILHIDLPICFALVLAFCVSLASLMGILEFNRVYFDSVSGLIFLLLSARALQDALLAKGKRLCEFADTLLPPQANSLQKGDEFWVAHGENAPADGVVLKGESSFQEAVLTGEPYPVPKWPGVGIIAGTTNLGDPVLVRATEVGMNTSVGKLQSLVKNAQNNSTKFEQLSQKIVPWFVFATIVLAVSVSIFWLTKDASRALDVLTSTLIVSCPCAIALAVPLSRMLALRRYWKHGIVLKNADTIERLAQVDAVVLDKTGTLSDAKLVVNSHVLEGENSMNFWRTVYYMSSASTHPVACAIKQESLQQFGKHKLADASNNSKANKDICNLENGNFSPLNRLAENSLHSCLIDELVKEVPGKGLIYGDYVMGSARFVAEQIPKWRENLDSLTKTEKNRISCVATKNTLVVFSLGESWKKNISLILQRLSEQFPELHIATGDAAFTSADLLQLNQSLGAKISLHGGCTPQEKLQLVEQLQNNGKRVLFLGDGVNDAAALAKAHVGLAVGQGADLALLSSAGFVGANQVKQVPNLFNVAKYENNTLRFVIALSVFYNLVAVIFAAQGYVHPLIAALIMPISGITTLLVASCRTGKKLWKFSTI